MAASAFTAFDQLSRADWTRATAGSADRVDPNVLIGGYLAAADPRFVRREGITRIVKLFADDPSYPGGATRLPGVRYLVLAAEDLPGFDIRPAAFAALRFVQAAIADNAQVLVHCHAGVSRSATVVLLHLMINRGYTLEAAIGRLRFVRGVICPNPGFLAHLRMTDARLQALRVGDERRPVSVREAEWPYAAPRPTTPYDVACLARFAGAGAHAGGRSAMGAADLDDADAGEPPGSFVAPIAPPPPRVPSASRSAGTNPYDSTPV